MHVFGPYDRFPVAESGAYALPLADRVAHEDVLGVLGIDHALLIQPSPYGTDHRALLDAIAQSAGRHLGIGSCDGSATAETLCDLRAKGIVGLRFVAMRGPNGGRYPGTQGLEELAKLREKIADAGIHVHLWADAETGAEVALSFAPSSGPVVLDHLAGLSAGDRPGTYAFDRVADALATGHVWVKLTYFRRSSLPLDYSDMRDVVEALCEAAPHRVIWGSDWPFVRTDRRPDGGAMLDQLRTWLGNEAFERCVKDNPRELLETPKMLDAANVRP
jgi:predicted TIM-barrel fold metal-dependent hydrolase